MFADFAHTIFISKNFCITGNTARDGTTHKLSGTRSGGVSWRVGGPLQRLVVLVSVRCDQGEVCSLSTAPVVKRGTTQSMVSIMV
jgi:hypothetical protein